MILSLVKREASPPLSPPKNTQPSPGNGSRNVGFIKNIFKKNEIKEKFLFLEVLCVCSRAASSLLPPSLSSPRGSLSSPVSPEGGAEPSPPQPGPVDVKDERKRRPSLSGPAPSLITRPPTSRVPRTRGPGPSALVPSEYEKRVNCIKQYALTHTHTFSPSPPPSPL